MNPAADHPFDQPDLTQSGANDSARLLAEMQRRNISGPGGAQAIISELGLTGFIPVSIAWFQLLALAGWDQETVSAHASDWANSTNATETTAWVPLAIQLLNAAVDATHQRIPIQTALLPILRRLVEYDDAVAWEMTWWLCDATDGLVSELGGNDQFLTVAVIHESFDLAPEDPTTRGIMAMIISAMMTGSKDRAISAISTADTKQLAVMLGQWTAMAATFLPAREQTSTLVLDAESIPQALLPNTTMTTDGLTQAGISAQQQRVHLALLEALDAYRTGGLRAAAARLAVLNSEDRLLSTWNIAWILATRFGEIGLPSDDQSTGEPWLIIDHATFGSSLPMIFIPEATLSADDATSFGFTTAFPEIPQSKGLSIDIGDPQRPSLWTTSNPRPGSGDLVEVTARQWTAHRWLHSPTPEWQREASAARGVIIATGPGTDYLTTPPHQLRLRPSTRWVAAPVILSPPS